MREIAAVMDPEDDFQTIVNAENQMNARDNERQEAMKEGRRKLKGEYVLRYGHWVWTDKRHVQPWPPLETPLAKLPLDQRTCLRRRRTP